MSLDFPRRISELSEADRTVMADTIKQFQVFLRACNGTASEYLEDRYGMVNLLTDLDAVIERGGETRRLLIEKHQFPRADEIVVTRLKK